MNKEWINGGGEVNESVDNDDTVISSWYEFCMQSTKAYKTETSCNHGILFLPLISASWHTLCIRFMSCPLPLKLFNSNLVLFTIIYSLTLWLHLQTPSLIMPQSLISTVWTWWYFVAVSCGHLQFLLVQHVHSSTCFQLHTSVPHTCETATVPLNL